MIALVFAAANYRAAKRCRCAMNCIDVYRSVPYYIEAEAIVLVGILFTAASLSSQPPAVDIPNLTATWSQVIATFHPRIPRINSPSHAELLAGRTRQDSDHWSNTITRRHGMV